MLGVYAYTCLVEIMSHTLVKRELLAPGWVLCLGELR